MKRIFSIETRWEQKYELGAKPMLDAVASYHGATVEHRFVEADDQIPDLLLEWDKKDLECCFVHLWLHGSPGGISVHDDSDGMTLDQILGALRKHPNDWDDCVMHFGACSTMSADPSKLREFLAETGLSAISGYEIDVDWIEPLALESIYLHYLLETLGDTQDGATEKHMRIVRDRLTNTQYTPALCDALRFRMLVRGD